MPGIAKPKGLEWDDEKMQAVLSLSPDFFQADDSAQYKHLLPLAISNSGIIGSEFSPERMGVRLRALEALVNLHLEVETPRPPWIESHHRQPGAQSATFTSTPSCHTSRPG